MLKNIITLVFLSLSLVSYTQLYPNNTFTVSNVNACIGEELTFTSTSTPGTSGLAIIKEKWDLGDGTVTEVNGANNTITHTYNTTGTKNVFFFATNANGTNDIAYSIEITVSSIPSANFNITANSCSLPTSVNVSNTSSNGAYTYDWDFGDGQTSTHYNPSGISYSSANTYLVSLTVTSTSSNCSATISKNIIINEFTADFTLSDDEICENESVSLTDISSGSTGWSWNNGNNSTSNSQNPSFSYSTAGTYDISLTATNSNNGCSDQVTKSITVNPRPTISASANPSIGCAPLDVDFINNSTNGDTYEWDFGDGSTTFIGDTPPTHTYTSNGNFSVTIDASNSFGCTRQGTATVIQVSPPTSNFTSDVIDGCSPLDVQFSDLSTSSNPSADPIVSWSWDFGNGNTSTSQSPLIETFVSGKYDVSLVVTTQNGCKDSINIVEYIQVGEIDSVGFSNTPDTICAKTGTVSFTDLTSIIVPFDPPEVTYEWDFGDSAPGTSTQKATTYSYPSDTGSFDVSLTVTFRGCVKTYVKDSAVFAWSPLSNFTADSGDKCSPASFPVQFDATDESKIGRSGDDVEMIYKWGDPLNSTTNFTSVSYDSNTDQWSSSFNYTNYGTYTIWQVVTNNTTGCVDSTQQEVTISKVAADFTLSPDTICLGDAITLTDLSSTALGTISSLSYDMTENIIAGNVGGISNYTFLNSGLNNITLTATDDSGCTGDTTLQVTVFSLPVASFSADDQTPCAPQTILYTNNSGFSGSTHATSITNSVWTLADGSNINNITEDVSYNIPTQGSFTTSLQVTDDFGCVSNISNSTITVSKPIANFNDPGTICNNDLFNVINSSTNGGTNYQWTLDNVLISTDDDLNYTINETSTVSTTFNYKLTLIAADVNGCLDSTSQQITVSAPKAELTYTLTGDNQSSSNEFTCPPVTIENIVNNSTSPNISNWSFGNGNVSNADSPSATYSVPDTYTLSLNIINQFGCTDDTVLVDYLIIGGPKATPIVTPPIDICKNLFTFSVTDTSQVDSYSWDFGDNTSSILDSVEHGYPLAGTYYPILTVYDDANCSVKFDADIISVLNELTAKHSASPNPGETNESITFTDQSLFKDSIVSWFWEFGDFENYSIENSTNSNQQFAYKYPYTYTSVLTVTDKFGCTSSDTVLVKITGDFEKPNVFTPNNDGINDVFEFHEDIFESYDVLVLNRWGNIVYDKKGVKGTYIWNGTHNDGKECSDGVYFFKIVGTIKDGTPFETSGYVTKVKG